MGKGTTIEVFRGNERKQIDLDLKTPIPKYLDNPYAEPTSVTGSLTSDNIAIVKVTLFPGKIGIDFANALSDLFQSRLTGAERLLLDLRGNSGGSIGNFRVMSLFTPRRQPVGYSLDRITAERGTPKERLPRLGKIPSQKWELIPLALKFGSKKSVVLETEGLGPQPFHGHIVILVNEHTTGAGYQLVFPVAAYQSWNGTRIQGRGIDPDVRVLWSFEDTRRGIDTQLRLDSGHFFPPKGCCPLFAICLPASLGTGTTLWALKRLQHLRKRCYRRGTTFHGEAFSDDRPISRKWCALRRVA